MAQPTDFELKLIEKMTRAKIALENFIKKEHSEMCPVNDPESLRPCSCGLSEHNQKVNEIINLLEIQR